MDRTTAALRINRSLREIENDIDTLLSKAGRFAAEVTDARLLFDESAIATQRAISRIASLNQLLVHARQKTCGVHADLAKVAAQSRDIPMTCPPDCLDIEEAPSSKIRAAA